MPKATLSAQFALTAQCQAGKKKTDYYDTATTGFCLEVRSTGGKTYYLRYQDQHGGHQARPHRIERDITQRNAKVHLVRRKATEPTLPEMERSLLPGVIEASIAPMHRRQRARQPVRIARSRSTYDQTATPATAQCATSRSRYRA